MLEKTLESPLDCKEIQPVHSKGDQSWVFIGRMVRQWQNLFYEQRYSATVLNDAVDFVKLAEAMGAEGVRASTREEFKEAFANALKSGHPVVIDCQIDSDDKVWPMVAPGEAISSAFTGDDLKKKQEE